MSSATTKQLHLLHGRGWIVLAAIATLVVILFATKRMWLPQIEGDSSSAPSATEKKANTAQGSKEEAADHTGHDHAGHSETSSLELSQQARSNIGLKTAKVELRPFERTINIPGVVVERPGRSEMLVSALLGGVVTKIYPILGEVLEPGAKLFDIRLTHEELVQAQANFLRTAEELDVIATNEPHIDL